MIETDDELYINRIKNNNLGRISDDKTDEESKNPKFVKKMKGWDSMCSEAVRLFIFVVIPCF